MPLTLRSRDLRSTDSCSVHGCRKRDVIVLVKATLVLTKSPAKCGARNQQSELFALQLLPFENNFSGLKKYILYDE